jgi:hypothetical protein
VLEGADKFEDVRAYGMREEENFAPTAMVVDCKHVDLFAVSVDQIFVAKVQCGYDLLPSRYHPLGPRGRCHEG